jgi:hypothetical protein
VTAATGFPRVGRSRRCTHNRVVATWPRSTGMWPSRTSKWGVICQQIYYRWFKGQTHDKRFSGHGAVATNLLRQAARVAGVQQCVAGLSVGLVGRAETARPTLRGRMPI